jgi:hypothetical protein
MIYIRERKMGRITYYSSNLTDRFCKLTELPFDKMDSQKSSVCIDTYELNGISAINTPFMRIFPCLNCKVINNLTMLKLEHVVDQLERTIPQGDKLLRFNFNNKHWVTDGVSLALYDARMDTNIAYTDKKSKYLMERAVIVQDAYIPLLILFLTNSNDTSYIPMSVSDDSLNEKYCIKPHSELVRIINEYHFNLTEDPRSHHKKKFFPILVIIALLSNGCFTANEISEIVSDIIPKSSIMTTAEFLIKGFHINPDVGKYGSVSYYTPQ